MTPTRSTATRSAKGRAITSLLSRVALLVVATLPVALLLLSLQFERRIQPVNPLSSDEVARVEQLLLENAPPDVATRNLQRLSLDAEELNLLLRYGYQLFEANKRTSADVSLPGTTLLLQGTVAVSERFLPVYVNFDAVFASTGDSLQLQSLQLGHITVPAAIVSRAGDTLKARYLSSNPEVSELLESVEEISIDPDRLAVDLQWEPALVSRLRTQAQQYFAAAGDQERIRRYYDVIANVASGLPTDENRVSATVFLIPLFDEALKQTAASGDPVAENRTLLQALAIYVNDQDISEVLSDVDAGTLRPRRVEIRLQHRADLAQHLVLSAAIAASAGAGLAAVLTNTKEAYDARYRSGFSFSDLTANIAGMALGGMAVASHRQAGLLQQRMAALVEETDFFPSLERASNRDGLSETDFNALYEDRTSEHYRERLAEIEALVYSRPVFQGMNPALE